MTALKVLFNNIPWGLVIWILYLAIPIVIKYKNNKDLSACVANGQHSDIELIRRAKSYIKTHPFSPYNSDLRLAMLRCFIICDNKEELKKTVHRVRIIDVQNQLTNYLIYTLFLLREKGFTNEYDVLLSRSAKRLQKQTHEWYLFFSEECKTVEILHDYSGTQYLQGIKYYYLGKQHIECGDSEKAAEFFSQALTEINDIVFQELLITEGHKQ